ncbi:MAG: 4-alpha-glucanotransferase [Prevotellaceae bacterium]|nr:4-alpha-glucanotransferase [Prevotellaceae bacterium]
MIISFEIEYATRWGEAVGVSIAYHDNEGLTHAMLPELSTGDGRLWRGDVTFPSSAVAVHYEYHIIRNREIVRREWEKGARVLSFQPQLRRIVCHDRWRDEPKYTYSLSSAFTEVFIPRPHNPLPPVPSSRQLMLRVFSDPLPRGCTLAASGNQGCLGNWAEGSEARLTEVATNEWALCLDAAQLTGVVEYKYLVLDESGRRIGWEMRDNRRLEALSVSQGMLLTLQDEMARLPFPQWRGAGCVVPVFSLRSEGGFGVGDFGDIKRMADWLALTGQHVLQILPINDTSSTGSWTDSYPYNCTSVYAFHPIYTDLRQLPPLKDSEQALRFEAVRKELNALPQLDYERVYASKMAYLRLIYQQECRHVLATAAYKAFYSENAEWLLPYAAFCYLRQLKGTSDFRQWGEWKTYDPQHVDQLLKPHTESRRELHFHSFVQYILHTQLLDACLYAKQKGVALKADIPIGVSRDSVDVWAEPHYFHTDGQAGAPPDAFSQNGQNWGFPTYDWQAMLQDGCRWWRRRLGKMAQYFSAYRIDHVLGFFRIWDIPSHALHAQLGQFSPSLPLSVKEIEAFGLSWRERDFTEPLITDSILLSLFHDRTADARHLYLESDGTGTYRLRPEYSTQRQVEQAFRGSKDTAMRDGLYQLQENVLFLRDREGREGYHPRIAAQSCLAYKALTARERDAFDRLYEQYFYHRHNELWREGALSKLKPLVQASPMLPCAEDLGMLASTVPEVLRQLGILSLDIQTMPKNPHLHFSHLWENQYLSVATITTHDMPTLRGWWEEQPTEAQRYYNEALGHEGPCPRGLPQWLAEEIVSQHLDCPSMLCLLSVQDWLALDETLRLPNASQERINIPAKPRHYWRWRLHLTCEQLLLATPLNDKIRSLIATHGRR